MKERPILFSGEMVRAILDGRKTMTRRVLKPQPEFNREFQGIEPCYYSPTGWAKTRCQNDGMKGCSCIPFPCRYRSGDRLWVRETWDFRPMPERVSIVGYRADESTHAVCVPDDANPTIKKGWRPSIFMPRWASRITLEIVNVRVERLQEISGNDIYEEGLGLDAYWNRDIDDGTPLGQFRTLWDSINGKKYPWASNPWVWVIEFKRL